MSRLRWALVALLVVSTGLFGLGVIAERSDADSHEEPAAAQRATEPEGAHDEESEGAAAEAGERTLEP